MRDKIYSLLCKKDNTDILLLILLLISLIIIAPYLPDDRPDRVRNELASWGYSVEHLEFNYVKDIVRGEEWVFRSSEPMSHEEIYVVYWRLTRQRHGHIWPHIRYEYSVEPYLPKY